MNYQTLFLLSISFFVSSNLVSAQSTKNEVERSIERSEMPSSSLDLLNQFWNEEKKVDFYRQSDGEKISYEAKVNWNGHQYSIEFDSEGMLVDVEQLIEFNDLTDALRNTITEEINKQYTRFRFTRIQQQYTISQDEDRDELLEEIIDGDFEDLTIRYEIEVDAQNKDELGSFELLFDDNGNFLQKRRIVRRSLDNIW